MSPELCVRCGFSFSPRATPNGMCPQCLLFGGFDENPPGDELEVEDVRDAVPGYEVTHLLGRGGMGAVFRAREEGSSQDVAIKFIANRDFDPAFGSRFEREALALGAMDHPGIVASHGHGRTATGHWYLVMEYMAAGDLRRRMADGNLSEREALHIIEQVCAALDYAHKKGFVHRDIKPGNILVDAEGHVKVADFGLVKIVDKESGLSTLTHSFAGVGTPLYAAPEQVKVGAVVDHRVDIYAVGVVLYEMLTGEIPRGVFLPPSRKSGVRPKWDSVLSRALDARPEARFSSAAEFLRALSPVKETLLNPGARRRRFAMGGCAIAAACAMTGLYWPTDYTVRYQDSTIRITCADAGKRGRLTISADGAGSFSVAAEGHTFRNGVGFPKRSGVDGIKCGNAERIEILGGHHEVWFNGRLLLSPGTNLEMRGYRIQLESGAALVAQGKGGLSFSAMQTVLVKEGAEVTSEDGGISMEANMDGTATGAFSGVDVIGGLIQVKGAGELSLRATGGDTDDDACGVKVSYHGRVVGGTQGKTFVFGRGGRGPTLSNTGVFVRNDSVIGSAGSDVVIDGTGGNGEGSFGSAGIRVHSNSRIFAGGKGELHVEGRGGAGTKVAASGGVKLALGSKIESEGGNVFVKGVGGTGTANEFAGVWLDNAKIAAAATGNVTIEGIAGTVLGGPDTTAVGVDIRFSSSIMSSAGDVRISGIGGRPLRDERGIGAGVRILGGAVISTGDKGSITVEGTGRDDKAAGHEGILLLGTKNQTGAARITALNGPVTVRAISEGRLGHALYIGGYDTSQIECGGDGRLLIQSDSLLLEQSGRIKANTGVVAITPTSPGVGIHAGGVDVLDGNPRILGIDEAELNRIEAQKIELGDKAHPDVSVEEKLSPENRARIFPYPH